MSVTNRKIIEHEIQMCIEELSHINVKQQPKQANFYVLSLIDNSARYFSLHPEKIDDIYKTTVQQLDAVLQKIVKEKKKYHLAAEQLASLDRTRQAFQSLLQPEQAPHFAVSSNKKLFDKWVACGFAEEPFFLYPDLVSTLFDAHLQYSIRAFGHELKFDPKTKELQMMVSGKYQNVTKLLQSLKREGEFLVSKNNPQEKNLQERWYYIGTGLAKWDSKGWQELQPMAKLDAKELAHVQERAKKMLSQEAQKTPKEATYTVELITSWTKPAGKPLLSGFEETFRGPRHPWIRLITDTGQVYSIGFGLYKSPKVDSIAATVKGSFRSPDPWETIDALTRQVTRVGITEKEFKHLKTSVEKYHNEGIAFNFLHHNCTRFVHHVLNDFLGIHASFEVGVDELAFYVLPVGVKRAFTTVGREIGPAWEGLKVMLTETMPPIVFRVLNLTKNFFTRLLLMPFGGAKIPTVREFGEKPTRFQAFEERLLRSIAIQFGDVRPILPRKLVEWQMQQASTTVYPASAGFYGQYGKKTSTS